MKIFEDVQIQIDKPSLDSIQSGGMGFNFIKDSFSNFYCLQNFLSQEEIQAIRHWESYLNFYYGKTVGQSSYSSVDREDDRYCLSASVPCNDITLWIYEKIAESVKKINDEYFHFDIDRIDEKIQYLKYEECSHKFDWHMDRWDGGPSRKFAVILQLSDDNEYEGGDIELMLSKQPLKMSRHIGSLTIFPSYLMHRVTEVTKGTRHSLLCLIGGPPFR